MGKMFGDTELEAPKLARFSIIGRLGQGGMGTVYAAYDPRLDRKVALKVLRKAGDPDPERRARLLREAQTLAQLSHPNVVAVHEVGTVDEQVFLALEYVDGGSLADTEEDDTHVLLDWLVQAGRGLEAAHQRGLVHRDVKPANILVTKDGRAKVSDFGLATSAGRDLESTAERISIDRELADDIEHEAVLQTETGAIVGTPAYMAPEQFDGAPVDARSDQFAYCVTVFRMLEGSPPFAGTTIAALRESIAGGPRPAKRLPGWLERVLAKGLVESPSARHGSMTELLDAIERGRRGRNWGRSALLVGFAGAAASAWMFGDEEPPDPCAALGDALTSTWNDERQGRIRERFVGTERPFATSAWERTAARVDGYVASWTEMAQASCRGSFHAGTQSAQAHDLRMACLGDARLQLTALVDLLEDADGGVIERVDRLLSDLPDLAACERVEELRALGTPPQDPSVDDAREQIAFARSAFAAGRLSKAREAAMAASVAAEASGWAPLRAEALLALGKAEQELGAAKDAEENLRAAIDLAEANHADRVLAEAWIELLSNVVDFQARIEPLESLSRRAESVLHRIDDPVSLRVRYLTTLGRAYEIAGDWVEARDAVERAMKLADSEASLPASIRINTLHQLAGVSAEMGDPERAVELHTEALELAKARLGEQHPTVGKLLSALATDYMDVPDHERALALFDASIDLRASLGIPAAQPYSNRGQLLVNMGRPREALPDFDRAIALFSEKAGEDHPTNGVFLLQKATAYLSLGDNETARDVLAQADAKLAPHLPPDHPHRLAAAINLASVLQALDQPQEALTRVQQAKAALEELSSPCSQAMLSTREVVAKSLVSVRRPAEALAEYDAIVACWETREPDAIDVVASVKWGRAKALRALGREDEARRLGEEARSDYAQLGYNYTAEVEALDQWLGE